MKNKTENEPNPNSEKNPYLKPILIFVIVFAIAFFGTRTLMAYFK